MRGGHLSVCRDYRVLSSAKLHSLRFSGSDETTGCCCLLHSPRCPSSRVFALPECATGGLRLLHPSPYERGGRGPSHMKSCRFTFSATRFFDPIGHYPAEDSTHSSCRTCYTDWSSSAYIDVSSSEMLVRIEVLLT